jgi:predicted ATPase
LRSAVLRGVVAVVETHSALLLREIQTLVATDKISKDDVKLHWMQRGMDGGTTITPADLDEHGAYGNWPEDFDQTELEAEKAYLDAVESREAGL